MPKSSTNIGAPPGFLSFCIRHADQCATTHVEKQSQIVVLNDEIWDALREVNYSVNKSITFRDDAVHYGRPEYWDIAVGGYGDCDEYVLTKRKLLIEKGFPVSALRVTIARTPQNIGHAVLTVATDQGDYILDNRNWQILPWTAVSYEWVSQQDSRDPMKWVSLRRAYPTLVASTNVDEQIIVASDPAPNMNGL
jgi:predicted transglutaminase-like cysteine proteinase